MVGLEKELNNTVLDFKQLEEKKETYFMHKVNKSQQQILKNPIRLETAILPSDDFDESSF